MSLVTAFRTTQTYTLRLQSQIMASFAGAKNSYHVILRNEVASCAAVDVLSNKGLLRKGKRTLIVINAHGDCWKKKRRLAKDIFNERPCTFILSKLVLCHGGVWVILAIVLFENREHTMKRLEL